MTERQREKGYFQLEGKDWSTCISQLKFYIGRNTKNQQNVDLHLGDSTLISRKHAKIQYDFNQYRFVIKCLSRNGLKINSHLYRRHHGAIKLESRDNIQVGPTEFTFLLPFKTAKRHEKQKFQRETRTAKRKRSSSSTTAAAPLTLVPGTPAVGQSLSQQPPGKRIKIEHNPLPPQVPSPPPPPIEPMVIPVPQQKKLKKKKWKGQTHIRGPTSLLHNSLLKQSLLILNNKKVLLKFVKLYVTSTLIINMLENLGNQLFVTCCL